MELEQTYARSPFAKMINQTPGYFWCSNRNINPKFYIKGSPDGYIAPEGVSKSRHTIDVGFQAAIMGKQIIGVEFKAASSTNYSSINLFNWSDDQDTYWRENFLAYGRPYYIVCWLYEFKHPKGGNILKKYSALFAVPPEAWIAMRTSAALEGRETVALTPELERIGEKKELTLLPAWEPYRLIPTGSTYAIPETHPLRIQLT